MKQRRLTTEESQLWRIVTANVRPLTPRKTDPPSAGATPVRDHTSIATHAVAPSPPVRVERKPLGDIERRTRRDLLKGKVVVDARLDLHGQTLAEAHQRVTRFLHRAQDEEARYVLIVTGKGKTTGGEFGPLRRQTPMWLADPRLRHIVAAYGEASPAHGGAGALYVRIRRKRDLA